ncbi:hypothetical protein ONZ45_g6461 [Pleurotus djamor]|nr:hypothetical protein ONZ45_g6461 [Pleurotus djamor]
MVAFNIFQQTWVLCVASGIANNLLGTQVDLQNAMSANLQPTLDYMQIGNWKVAWGPNVWKANSTDAEAAADHTWYIAHNPAAIFEDEKPYDTYVVSIAGTAPTSKVAATENADVDKVVDFNQWARLGFDTPPPTTDQHKIDPTEQYIALGTAHGVNRLLTIPTKEGVTLPQFLGTIPKTSRIVFTGHSLGGALSPTVAMAAVTAGMVKVPVSNVFTYPVAGPTVGNSPFAALYAKTFPRIDAHKAIYEVWNTVIWNTYDIVPHAWNSGSAKGQSLLDMPGLYGKLPWKLDLMLHIAVIAALKKVCKVPVYIPLQGTQVAPTAKPDTPKTRDELMQIAVYQHYLGYYDVIGTPIVPTLRSASNADKLDHH